VLAVVLVIPVAGIVMAANSLFVSLTISGSENDLLPDPEFFCKGEKNRSLGLKIKGGGADALGILLKL
jgi:hypothetical protein